MSHFFVEVMVPRATKPDDLNDTVAQLLAAYDENQSVSAYKRPCYCVGAEARKAARDGVSEKLGDIDLVRSDFNKRHPDLAKISYYTSSEEDVARVDAVWSAEVVEPRTKLEEELYKAHPLAEKPRATCEECQGTGLEETTYNPKSKWDWWQIGGRWSGVLSGYDPEKDPRNQERCFVCNGTGRRDDELGREQRAADPTYTCNNCRGTGTSLKWPTDWVDQGNVVPVSEVLAKMKAGESDAFPYAYVTPKGEWRERGEMGWFGISRGDKQKDVWRTEVIAEFEKYQDYLIVGVDCHI